jgi:hypothetical protein
MPLWQVGLPEILALVAMSGWPKAAIRLFATTDFD